MYQMTGDERKAVTMKDVAARAGVSPTVVSHVLHHKATSIRVSAATAERVRQAAQDLAYRVNVAARNFRDRQTTMLGVVHGHRSLTPRFDAGSRYFAALMDGIVDGAFAHGFSVALCPRLFGQTPEDAMSDGRFDGLIWYSSNPNDEDRAMIDRCSVPLVLIHSPGDGFDRTFPSVMCDNAQGIGLAVDHLVGLGHRRIAFALPPVERIGEGRLRELGLYAALERHGLEADSERNLWLVQSDEEIDERLLAPNRSTAVIAWSDGMATHLIERATALGLDLPRDLSIVGFDSTSYCNELRPRLTSISQPLVPLGRTAVDLLVQSVRGDLVPSFPLLMPCGLDLRESTARPRTH